MTAWIEHDGKPYNRMHPVNRRGEDSAVFARFIDGREFRTTRPEMWDWQNITHYYIEGEGNMETFWGTDTGSSQNDWRKYASTKGIRSVWNTLTKAQQNAVQHDLQAIWDREEWE